MMEQLTASDGYEFDCWMEPAQGPVRGGIVILQEIFGVTDQLKDLARDYAAEGWAVAIPALFDRQERGAVVDFSDIDRARALMAGTDRADCLRDIAAAVAALTPAGNVGVLGFCWGGGLALAAAQALPVGAAVAFYGTRLDSYLGMPAKAPFQGHFGHKDDHTPVEILDRIRAEIPEAEIFTYDAGHAFANDRRPSYVPGAAALAHERTKTFFASHLG